MRVLFFLCVLSLPIFAQQQGAGMEATFAADQPVDYTELFPHHGGFRVVVVRDVFAGDWVKVVGSTGFAQQEKVHTVSNSVQPNGQLQTTVEADGWNWQYDLRARLRLVSNGSWSLFGDGGISGGRLVTSQYSKNSLHPLLGAGLDFRDLVQVTGGYRLADRMTFSGVSNRSRGLYAGVQWYPRLSDRWRYSVGFEYRRTVFEQPAFVTSSPGTYRANVLQLHFGVFRTF